MCAYEKVCAYKKGALNNPSLRYAEIEHMLAKIFAMAMATSTGEPRPSSADREGSASHGQRVRLFVGTGPRATMISDQLYRLQRERRLGALSIFCWSSG